MKSVIDTEKENVEKNCCDFSINKYLCNLRVYIFTIDLISGELTPGLTPALLQMYCKFIKLVFGKWETPSLEFLAF